MNSIELLNAATAAAQKDDFVVSESLVRRALQIDPSNGIAWGMLGSLLLQLERCEEAIEALNHAITLQPTLSRAYATLARAHARIGQLEIACENLIIAIRQKENAEWISDLAWIYLRMGKHGEAEKQVSRALEIDSANIEALLLYSRIVAGRDPQEAHKLILRAHSIDPVDIEPLLELGVLALEDKQYGKAQELFSKALTIDEALWLRLGLALSLYKQSRLSEAENEYKSALKRYPCNDQAVRSFAAFYNDIGKSEEAEALLRTIRR